MQPHPKTYLANFPMFYNPMFSTFIPMQFLQFFLFLYFATLHSKGALKVGGKVSRMFTLSQIEHDLPMPPHLMSRPILDAIKAELERLFLDKVCAFLFSLAVTLQLSSKICSRVPAILGLNPSAPTFVVPKCLCLFGFGYDAGHGKPWALHLCL